MAQNIATVEVDLRILGQPEICKEMRSEGWVFSYDNDTNYITAIHPRGGMQSIAAITLYCFHGKKQREVGEAIAMLLNGGNHNK